MTAPTLPSLELSDDERGLMEALKGQLTFSRLDCELRDAYYRGEQVVRDLGISIPPQMRQVRTVIGWPRIGVDALEQRLDIESWRYADESGDTDSGLMEIWEANDGATESQMAHLDALVFGREFITVGSGDCRLPDGSPKPDCPPLISVESPLDMTTMFDARLRVNTSGLRVWDLEGSEAVTLYLPNETVSAVSIRGGSHWEVLDRDPHNLGIVPIVRMSNRERTGDRFGQSEITEEVMNVTDAACRTLLGMEVAREFYGAPQRYILGADESAFQDAEGNKKSAWQTYIGRVLALENDAEGNRPEVGQFTAYDPSVFTRIIDMYAKIMATQLGLPPHYLGYTTDNPASADAIRSTEAQLVKRAERKQRVFTGSWRNVMRLAVLMQTGTLPDNNRKMEPVWRDASTPTVAATADATVKLVQAGVLPASSTVTLERTGFTAGEIARILADRQSDAAASFLAEIATSLQAKEARVDTGLAADLKATPPAVTSGTGPAGG